MDICIDFDGTCVTHDFPEIGKDIGAIPVLKKLIEKEHNLILFTMRSDVIDPNATEWQSEIILKSGNYLTEAIQWFEFNDVKLYGVQINPTQCEWTSSPKAYGQIYIDDAALGIPLIFNPEKSDRPFVDWVKVEQLLIEKGVL